MSKISIKSTNNTSIVKFELEDFITRNQNFEFTEFLQKLKTQPTALQDCTNVTNYKVLIEEIYNYRRREKINLRY